MWRSVRAQRHVDTRPVGQRQVPLDQDRVSLGQPRSDLDASVVLQAGLHVLPLGALPLGAEHQQAPIALQDRIAAPSASAREANE